MLVALLAVLGVDLIVIVILLAVPLIRRRWVSPQCGAVKGAVPRQGRRCPGPENQVEAWVRALGQQRPRMDLNGWHVETFDAGLLILATQRQCPSRVSQSAPAEVDFLHQCRQNQP